jgi:hypothetical protein
MTKLVFKSLPLHFYLFIGENIIFLPVKRSPNLPSRTYYWQIRIPFPTGTIQIKVLINITIGTRLGLIFVNIFVGSISVNQFYVF